MQQASIAEDDVASANLARLDGLQHERVQLEEEMQSRLMLQLVSTEQQLHGAQDTLTIQQVCVAPRACLNVICIECVIDQRVSCNVGRS